MNLGQLKIKNSSYLFCLAIIYRIVNDTANYRRPAFRGPQAAKLPYKELKTQFDYNMTTLKIGLAGLGTVGKGVYDILKKDADIIAKRTKFDLKIVAAGSRTKKDFLDDDVKFYDNVVDLANDSELDIIIEAIGGNTLAKDLCEAALKNGKKFVTANKALLAQFGFELAKLAEQNDSYIGYESSTAASIPVIKTFKEGLSANEIEEFYAILNGTCNFILTKMEQENLSFDVALKQAQELGYAEADPTFDVKGIDTAHKLALLAAIASGTKPAFDQLSIEGVDEVSIDDINLAKDLGYKFKVLAIYKKLAQGKSQQTVYPALIKSAEKIAQVDDSYNAVLVKASNADWNFGVGRGAGGLPTASAIVADLVDIANERSSYTFGVGANDLGEANISKLENRVGAYFIRLVANKELAQNGQIAQDIFAGKVEIEKSAFIDQDENILCGFLTKSHKEQDIIDCLNAIDDNKAKSAKFFRVEEIVGF